MLDIPINDLNLIRCPKCNLQTEKTADSCGNCGNSLNIPGGEKLTDKIKRLLGVDTSSEIITINLQDEGHFFSNQEIESLLNLENVTVLGLEDVPDRDSIFYKSKRISKPLRRK